MKERKFCDVLVLHYPSTPVTPGFTTILISRMENNPMIDIQIPVKDHVVKPDYHAYLSEIYTTEEGRDVAYVNWIPIVRHNAEVTKNKPPPLDLDVDYMKFYEDKEKWQEIIGHFVKCKKCDRMVFKKTECSLHNIE